MQEVHEVISSQIGTWRTELENFQKKGLLSLGFDKDGEFGQHIQTLQQQLSALETSASKEKYDAILLEATRLYFKHLNELSLSFESCKKSEGLKPTDRYVCDDQIFKILNVCAGYEQVLDAIARDSDSDRYTKQVTAAFTLLSLMCATLPALLFGVVLGGLLINFNSMELPMQLFLGGLDAFIGLVIVSALGREIRSMLHEKDILTTVINKYQDDHSEAKIKADEPLNDTAPLYDEFREQVRDLRRELFGNFGPLFHERESAYSIAKDMRSQIKISLRN